MQASSAFYDVHEIVLLYHIDRMTVAIGRNRSHEFDDKLHGRESFHFVEVAGPVVRNSDKDVYSKSLR